MTATDHVAHVMQSLDSLNVVPVWVDPNHMVESARILMDGHDLSALAVLDHDGRPIGTLRRDVAAAIPGNARVGEVMEPVLGILDYQESLRQAADLLVRIDRHYAPMLRDGKFLGIVTALDLLDGLRRSWDPMTDLPWSDELRRWGAAHLEHGHEIAVIFIDLDRFGSFNKRFGHVVGDRVLTRIADFLRDQLDPAQDVLVRYGGDEFAIGTLRAGADTQDFADRLLSTSRATPLMESGEPILFSIGVYGGQRQRERDDMHVQATLDDLINLASRRCLASKPNVAQAAQSGFAVVATSPATFGGEVSGVPVPVTAEATDEAGAAMPIAPVPDVSKVESVVTTEPLDSDSAPTVDSEPDIDAFVTPSSEDASLPAFMLRSREEETSAGQTEPVAPVVPVAPESSAGEAGIPDVGITNDTISSSTVEPEITPVAEAPSVVEVQIEDDPNSLTHVVLKGGGRVWVGVGLRLGRSVESTVAYATGKALERAYAGRTLRIDATRGEDGRIVIQGIRTENGVERPVRAVSEDNTPESVAGATIAAFLS